MVRRKMASDSFYLLALTSSARFPTRVDASQISQVSYCKHGNLCLNSAAVYTADALPPEHAFGADEPPQRG